MSPVELLLAAVAGCSAVDVDVVTSRRAEPELFDVHVDGTRINEDGASRLSDVDVEFSLRFSDTEAGRQAQSMIERLVRISHEKDCTVSRTVENPTTVTFRTREAYAQLLVVIKQPRNVSITPSVAHHKGHIPLYAWCNFEPM